MLSFDRPAVSVVAGEIVEGKRTKKTVDRLDFQAPKQKEKLKIGDGESLTVRSQKWSPAQDFLLCSQAQERSSETSLAPASRSPR